MRQSGKQATPNSLKALKSRTGDTKFCEDLSGTVEEFSQHRFDTWQLLLFLRYITSANINFCVGAMLCVQQSGSHLNLLITMEKNFPIILWSHQEDFLASWRCIEAFLTVTVTYSHIWKWGRV